MIVADFRIKFSFHVFYILMFKMLYLLYYDLLAVLDIDAALQCAE